MACKCEDNKPKPGETWMSRIEAGDSHSYEPRKVAGISGRGFIIQGKDCFWFAHPERLAYKIEPESIIETREEEAERLAKESAERARLSMAKSVNETAESLVSTGVLACIVGIGFLWGYMECKHRLFIDKVLGWFQ